MKNRLDLSSFTDDELAVLEEAAHTACSIASDDRTATTAPSSIRASVPTVPQRFTPTHLAPDLFSTFFADPAHDELYDASAPLSSKFLRIAT
eukprot:9143288-Ditylum_brightwellii.AAC.1